MRCKFRAQASTATQCQANNISYPLTQSGQWIAGKIQMATLVVLLGLGGGFWVNTEANAQIGRYADAPQIAQAEAARVDLSITCQPDETYETLLSRAEGAALTAVKENFDQDSQVTGVSVMVVAQNHGEIAPVLSLEVSRPQWLSRPDIQRWVTYFTSARSLLGFDGQSGTATATTPEQAETATPASTPEQAETATPATPEQPTDSAPGNAGTDNPVTPQAPSAVPASSGTTINNPTPTSAPNNSGIPNDNPDATSTTPNSTVPATTLPNTPGNVNNTTPGTTSNQQNVIPNNPYPDTQGQ